MFVRRMSAVFAAVLTVGSFAVLPGCNWLKGSDSGSRLSPSLSNLAISPASVLCGEKFSVSFRYDDPQGDIASVHVTFLRSGDTTSRVESPAWPDKTSKSSGTATFDFSFSCTDDKGGLYSVTVQVDDDRGHTSNSLAGEIRLNAAG